MIRRMALLAALLTALCAPAHADPAWIIQLDGAAALVDARGDVRIGGVPRVFEVRKHALYAAGDEGGYRLYDVGGNAVGSGEFAMIHAGAKAGVYELRRMAEETALSAVRAGATLILSYFTPEFLDVSSWLYLLESTCADMCR